MAERVVHCWAGKTDYYEELYGPHSPEHIDAMMEDVSSTCMREDGHDGAHEWTPDNCIGVSFAAAGHAEGDATDNE